MKIIVAPDKFKGSLTSFEVCRAIGNGIRKTGNNSSVHEFPMADGGDGFAAVMKYYLHTQTVQCPTVDPLGRKITAAYEWDANNRTAIIEMAVASGLVLLTEDERDPLLTSTLGTGLLIKNAMEKGAENIILGLGGSATNDAGTGILSALGFQLISAEGKGLEPSGRNLSQIRKIVAPKTRAQIRFRIASDVLNTLYGPHGAAHVYAPQKGADKQQVELLDTGLRNFASVIEQQTSTNVANLPGSGAAGGIVAGLLPFFDLKIENGVVLVAEAGKLHNEIGNADLIVTGEGQIDNQSSSGKVVGYMAALAKKNNIPCIAICGTTALTESEVLALGLKKVFVLQEGHITKTEAMQQAFDLVERTAANIPGLF